MKAENQVGEVRQTPQSDVRQRLNELTLQSGQWVAEQAQQLREQARQLQSQSRQLRKALRREAKQRRKLLKQIRAPGTNSSKDLLKRSERLTGEFVERGGKLSQDLLERSGKAVQGLAERSAEFTQEMAKRSSKVTHEIAGRRENLLESLRKRDRNFWAIIGFGIGLVAATIVTYRLVRQRVAQQVTEQEERIELPLSDSRNSTQGRPAGVIRHIDQGEAPVATLEIVDVEMTERPADATFVGVVSTKLYYPVDSALEPGDVVYFVSEEEAKAQGFTAAK
jgi:hypothetical protein